MIDLALVSVIRRWCLRDKLSIREVSRRTGLSKNTVKKYLRDENLEPCYPKCKRPSKLDGFTATLSSWLRLESRRNRKQRRCLRQLFIDLKAQGYEGSYDRVAAFAREWKRNQPIEQGGTQRGVFIPLRFAPGEAFQFDWSEDYAFSKRPAHTPSLSKWSPAESRHSFDEDWGGWSCSRRTLKRQGDGGLRVEPINPPPSAGE